MKQKTNLPSTLQGQYAGFVSRFIAFIIDVLTITAIVTILGITVDMITRFFQLDEIINTLMASDNVMGDALRLIALLGSVAFITIAYFVLMWTLSAGQSVGKLLMGLRIVPIDGSKISFWRSIVRYFAFVLTALLLFAGQLWVLVSDSRQGWHDKIAKTYVIYNWQAHETDGVIGNLQSRWSDIKHTRRLIRNRKAASKTGYSENGVDTAPEEIESAQS